MVLVRSELDLVTMDYLEIYQEVLQYSDSGFFLDVDLMELRLDSVDPKMSPLHLHLTYVKVSLISRHLMILLVNQVESQNILNTSVVNQQES